MIGPAAIFPASRVVVELVCGWRIDPRGRFSSAGALETTPRVDHARTGEKKKGLHRLGDANVRGDFQRVLAAISRGGRVRCGRGGWIHGFVEPCSLGRAVALRLSLGSRDTAAIRLRFGPLERPEDLLDGLGVGLGSSVSSASAERNPWPPRILRSCRASAFSCLAWMAAISFSRVHARLAAPGRSRPHHGEVRTESPQPPAGASATELVFRPEVGHDACRFWARTGLSLRRMTRCLLDASWGVSWVRSSP